MPPITRGASLPLGGYKLTASRVRKATAKKAKKTVPPARGLGDGPEDYSHAIVEWTDAHEPLSVLPLALVKANRTKKVPIRVDARMKLWLKENGKWKGLNLKIRSFCESLEIGLIFVKALERAEEEAKEKEGQENEFVETGVIYDHRGFGVDCEYFIEDTDGGRKIVKEEYVCDDMKKTYDNRHYRKWEEAKKKAAMKKIKYY